MRYFSTAPISLIAEITLAIWYCCIWIYNLHIPGWGLPASIYVVWQQIESSLPYLRAFASELYLIPLGRDHHVPVLFMRSPSKAQAWRTYLYRYNWTSHTYSATEIMKHQFSFINLFLQRKLLCAHNDFFFISRKKNYLKEPSRGKFLLCYPQLTGFVWYLCL